MKNPLSISLGLLLLIGCSKTYDVPGELQNHAPRDFALISPAEGAETDVYNITFEWERAQDPDNDNVTYHLYIAESGASPVRVATNITGTSHTLESRYSYNSSSTWYVIADDGKEAGETTSSERNFTTRNFHIEQILSNDSPSSFSPKRFSYTGLYFNDSFYIMSGYGEQTLGDVWTSRNYGQQWQLENDLDGTGFERYAHSSVVFNNKIWVIGGYDINPIGNIYSSANGINWRQEEFNGSFERRYHHTSVIFNNKIWVVGGYDDNVFMDDVMSWTGRSEESWELEASGARTPFDGIRGHTSVAFDNQIWVIGGEDRNEGYMNEVWSSPDGRNWTQNRDLPGITAYHKSVVFDNKIWVIGGLTDSGPSNSIYYFDGDTGMWNAYELPVEDFAALYNHAVIVVDEGTPDDGIYILGSFNGLHYFNDIWKLY